MVMRKISFILSLAIFYIPLSFYGAELEKVEVNTTSIRRTRTYASQEVYYALDGHRIKTLQKGINIIRQSDGTVRKEIVR